MAPIDADIAGDRLAMSLARAVAIANRRAVELGIDLQQHHVGAVQEQRSGKLVWQVDYVPTDLANRRGGGVSIDIDPQDGRICREQKCQ